MANPSWIDANTSSLAVVSEGEIVPQDRVLTDGDELAVLVPVAGG